MYSNDNCYIMFHEYVESHGIYTIIMALFQSATFFLNVK